MDPVIWFIIIDNFNHLHVSLGIIAKFEAQFERTISYLFRFNLQFVPRKTFKTDKRTSILEDCNKLYSLCKLDRRWKMDVDAYIRLWNDWSMNEISMFCLQ